MIQLPILTRQAEQAHKLPTQTAVLAVLAALALDICKVLETVLAGVLVAQTLEMVAAAETVAGLGQAAQTAIMAPTAIALMGLVARQVALVANTFADFLS